MLSVKARRVNLATWALCAAVLAGLVEAYDDDDDYKDDTKACNKWYPSAVENMCHENFPKVTSDKLHIILFSSHACYKCKQVEQGFVNWAKTLADDPSVVVGVVNCYWSKNYKSLCYPRHKVDALPTLRIIEKGQFETIKALKQPLSTMEDIDRMVRDKLESRPSCPEGVANMKDTAVLPLCHNRFPDEDSRPASLSWYVVFYAKAMPASTSLMNTLSEISVQLGNAQTSVATTWGKMKRRDRLTAIQEMYGDVSVDIPEQGPLGLETFAKVGGVCCDCNAEEVAFCEKTLGADFAPSLPIAAWIEQGELRNTETIEDSSVALMEFALTNLGFVSSREEL